MEYDIVFLKPEKFEDTKKILEYIKGNKIVHIGVANLNGNESQRVVDFISGAAYIMNAVLIQPSEKIFCTIPREKEYFLEENNASSKIDLRYNEEEEITPNYE